jgi:hypothetical protein
MINGTDVLVGNMRFCDLRTDQRANAVKATIKASQSSPHTRNRLAALREVKEAVEAPKAYSACLCKHRTVDGKDWLVMSVDCQTHGVFKENLAMNQKPVLVVGVGREGRKRVRDY